MTSEQENAQVERWHIERFIEFGFDWGQIESLLSWGTEPHDVQELLFRDGERTACSPEQALRILQPVDDLVVLVVH